jgi:predicted ribosomally synthesized peptide with SipW-like signal peptide
MSQHRAEVTRHRADRVPVRRSGRFRALLGLGLLGCVGTTGTWAHWTDQATVSGTSITAGTIDLRVNGSDTVTGFTTLNLATMVPGNSTAAVLTVANTGTAAVKYTVATTATNADGKGLAAALKVKLTADTGVTGSSPAQTCAGAVFGSAGDTLGGALVSTGQSLAAGATKQLCFQVQLPVAAASSLQGGTTTVTITFTGTSDLS